MRQDSVDGDASLLVRVESLVEQVAQEATVLRNALAVDALRWRDRFRIVFRVRREITEHREATARDNRISHDVNVFVKLARLESAVEVDVPIARGQFPVDGMREFPLIARDCRARSFAPIPHSQNISRIVRICDRILEPADSSVREVTERNFLHRFRQHQVAAQQPCDGLAVFSRDRRVELEPIGGIPLPAKADEGESFAEQPRVACVALGVPVSAIDDAQNGGVPAIRALEDHRPVAFGWIFRPDRDEIRGEFDFAALQRNRVGKVDDTTIVFVLDREGNVDAADDAFVSTGVAKGLAAEHIGARNNLDARHLCR